MRSTVSDSSGNPEDGTGREGRRERREPVRAWGSDRTVPREDADSPASGPGAGGADPGEVPDAGPDSVVDLVLDLVPGESADAAFGATSAAVSVPAGAGGPVPVPAPGASRRRTAPDTVFDSLPVSGGDGAVQSGDAPWGAGRHHAVIANERTATIPVHLLFREDAARVDAAALPEGVVRRGSGDDRPVAGVRRPPVPRGPQVRPPTRP
ncbi:membrane protease subunit, partial [Streptomyces sp. NPDC006435]